MEKTKFSQSVKSGDYAQLYAPSTRMNISEVVRVESAQKIVDRTSI